MALTEKVEQHLAKITTSAQDLIDITYEPFELQQICETPTREIIRLQNQKKNKTNLKKIKISGKARVFEPKPKREKLSTKKLKLTKVGLSYQDYLDRANSVKPDLTNIS